MLPVEIHQNPQGRLISAVQGVHYGCNKKMLPVETHQNPQGRLISAVQGVHHGCNKKMLPVEGKYFSLVLLGCQMGQPITVRCTH